MNTRIRTLAAAMILIAPPLAVAQTTPGNPATASNIHDLCVPALTRQYIEQKGADAESARYTANLTCTYFAQQCKAEPDGDTCKKAIRDFSAK